MPRMLNLQQIFELVKDRFQEGSSTEHDLVMQQEQTIPHVALQMRHQPQATGLDQNAGQRLGQIAPITEQAS